MVTKPNVSEELERLIANAPDMYQMHPIKSLHKKLNEYKHVVYDLQYMSQAGEMKDFNTAYMRRLQEAQDHIIYIEDELTFRVAVESDKLKK